MLIALATHPVTELLAICCFLTYVVLCARGNLWCWAAGFMTAFFYTFIFIGTHLPGQVVLNILYMLMSIWGWSNWLENRKADGISIYNYSAPHRHLLYGSAIILIAVASSLLLPSWFESSKPTMEAIVIGLSLYATILTIYRKIESWLFWIVVNIASFVVFFEQNLMQTSVMFCGMAFISGWGFYNWRRFRQQDERRVEGRG